MTMHVGIARIALHLAENGSLKGKRMVVKSITQRVRNRFNVAVAEVDTQDAWQVATLGIVCVSEDRRHSNEMLNKGIPSSLVLDALAWALPAGVIFARVIHVLGWWDYYFTHTAEIVQLDLEDGLSLWGGLV